MIIATAYKGADDLAVMQEAIARWVQQTGHGIYCHPGDIPHRLYNNNRGRFLLNRVARLWWDDETLVGFALCYPKHKAFDAFLHPDYRGDKLEREILIWAEMVTYAGMMKLDLQDEAIVADLYSGDTARREMLKSLGYTIAESPSIILNLRSLTDAIADPVLPDGFTIRSAAGEHEADKIAAVHSSAFGSNWTPELYRNEVMRKPGYAMEREMLVVAPDGQFAAFCVCWQDPINKIGLFEPVGTHSDFQRKGLASAMMNHTLRLMREWGMTHALVGNDTDNPASEGLYKKLGFRPVCEIRDSTKKR